MVPSQDLLRTRLAHAVKPQPCGADQNICHHRTSTRNRRWFWRGHRRHAHRLQVHLFEAPQIRGRDPGRQEGRLSLAQRRANAPAATRVLALLCVWGRRKLRLSRLGFGARQGCEWRDADVCRSRRIREIAWSHDSRFARRHLSRVRLSPRGRQVGGDGRRGWCGKNPGARRFLREQSAQHRRWFARPAHP